MSTLTFHTARAKCFTMRGASSLKRLTAALLLLMTALLAPTGIASAHQGHASSAPIQKHGVVEATADRQSVEQAAREVGIAGLTADARHDQAPCSDEGKPGHVAGCCTMACHAALTAPVLLVEPCRAPPSLAYGRPAQVLAGLSGARNERPPKLA